jgi:arylsulfatase A-like enzyme
MSSDYSLFIAVIIILLIFVFMWIGVRVNQNKKRDLRIPSKENYLSQINAGNLPKDAPNIIIMLCDDLGYGDISCFGSKSIKTPNIDALAEQGIRLPNFYASAPVCSPSRAGLLTGRYPVRAHMPNVLFPSSIPFLFLFSPFFYSYGMRGLPQDEITIPEVLQRAGYQTGMLGKWHLGDRKPYLPNNFGFNFFFGAHYSNDMRPYALYLNDEVAFKAPVDQNLITKRLTEQGLKFIEESKEKPFFLYYAQPFPHNPLHASEDFRGKSEAGLYGDAVQELDWSVGEIVKLLKKRGIFDNTLFIFTSDNGPWHEGNPGYHRGRKNQTYEGGFKVPFVACWPKKIKPKQENLARCSNLDLLPTILSLLELPIPTDRILDGKNMLDSLLGSPKPSPDLPFYYFWSKKLRSIRQGKWKYHSRYGTDNAAYIYLKTGPFLFDLEKDQNESYDLTTHYPEKAKELSDQLLQMKFSMKRNLRGWIN